MLIKKFKAYIHQLLIVLLCLGAPLIGWCANDIKITHKILGLKASQHSQWLNQVLLDNSALYKKPASNISQIRSRTKADIAYLNKAMRSIGFYSGHVDVTIDAQNLQQVHVDYHIDTGPIFVIKAIQIQADKPIKLPKPAAIDLKIDTPLIAETVFTAEKNLAQWIEQENCLTPVTIDRNITVDHKQHNATIVFHITKAQDALFGETTFTGLTSVDKTFLTAQLPWKVGDCFKPSLIDKAAIDFQRSNFFSQIATDFDDKPNAVGHIPVTFDFTEKKHRTVKAGMSFNTDEDFGVGFGWEHRNIFGKGQKLSADAHISKLFETIEVSYHQPIFKSPNQALSITTKFSHETLDAYDAISWQSRAIVDHKRKSGWTIGTGPTFHYNDVKDEIDDETFGLIGWIFQLKRDTRDDILNPKQGDIVHAEASPIADIFNNNTQFIKTHIEGRTYLSFDNKSSPVLALRAATGATVGSANQSLPKNQRFFAGGGGSVRGYGFQQLGDFEEGDPVGGRSFVEASIEGRFHLSQSIGAVAFLDGGNVYESITPEFDLRWAAGTGLRYYTGFFPIRFDMAFPLDKREGIDDDYQFYISIGQAF